MTLWEGFILDLKGSIAVLGLHRNRLRSGQYYANCALNAKVENVSPTLTIESAEHRFPL